jgi:hypothetical protein
MAHYNTTGIVSNVVWNIFSLYILCYVREVTENAEPREVRGEVRRNTQERRA